MKTRLVCVVLTSLVLASFASHAFAQDKEKKAASEESMVDIKLDDGAFEMKAPKSWKLVEPKSSMIEIEFKIPMADGDDAEKDGRLTIMAAGGGIEANIERWKGQFSQPDGSSTSDNTKIDVLEISGMKIHMVDIKGTFGERARMTDPPTMRHNYRMLAAIIETGDLQYFVKFYAGNATVEANRERFTAFIKSFSKSGN